MQQQLPQQIVSQEQQDTRLKKFIATFSMPSQTKNTPIQQLRKEVGILTSKIMQQQLVVEENKAQLYALLHKTEQPNIDYKQIKSQIDAQFQQYNASLLASYQILVDATRQSDQEGLAAIAKEIKTQFIDEILIVKKDKDASLQKIVTELQRAGDNIQTQVQALQIVARDIKTNIKDLDDTYTNIGDKSKSTAAVYLQLLQIKEDISQIQKTSQLQNDLLEGIQNMDNDDWWAGEFAQQWVQKYISKLDSLFENSADIKSRITNIVGTIQTTIHDGLQEIRGAIQTIDQPNQLLESTQRLEDRFTQFLTAYDTKMNYIDDQLKVQLQNQTNLQQTAELIKKTLTIDLQENQDTEMNNEVVGIRTILVDALQKSNEEISKQIDYLNQTYQSLIEGSKLSIQQLKQEQEKYKEDLANSQATLNNVLQQLIQHLGTLSSSHNKVVDDYQQMLVGLKSETDTDKAVYKEVVQDLQLKLQDAVSVLERNSATPGLQNIVGSVSDLITQTHGLINLQQVENQTQKKEINNLIDAVTKLSQQQTQIMQTSVNDVLTTMSKRVASQLEKQLNDKIDNVLADRKREIKQHVKRMQPGLNNFFKQPQNIQQPETAEFIQEEDEDDESREIEDRRPRPKIRGYGRQNTDEISLRSYSPALEHFRTKLDSKLALSNALNRFKLGVYPYQTLESFLQEQSKPIQSVIEVTIDNPQFDFIVMQYVVFPVLGMTIYHKTSGNACILVAILPGALFFIETQYSVCETSFSPQMQALLLGCNKTVQLFIGHLLQVDGRISVRFVQVDDFSSCSGQSLSKGGLCIKINDIGYLDAILHRDTNKSWIFDMYVINNHTKYIDNTLHLDYQPQQQLSPVQSQKVDLQGKS